MKRIFCVILAAIFVAGIFSSCSDDEKNNDSSLTAVDSPITENEDMSNGISQYSEIKQEFPQSVDLIQQCKDNRADYECTNAVLTIEGSEKMTVKPYKVNGENSRVFSSEIIELESEEFIQNIESKSFYMSDPINEMYITDDGIYLLMIKDSAAHSQTYELARWSRDGKYIGLFCVNKERYEKIYGYCGDYMLKGNLGEIGTYPDSRDKEYLVFENISDGYETEVNISEIDKLTADFSNEINVKVLSADLQGANLRIADKQSNEPFPLFFRVSVSGGCEKLKIIL